MDSEAWIAEHLPAAGPPELVHDKAWSRVWRVPLPGGEAAWFKACAPVQAFEPALTAKLYARWPDRVVEVIAHDVDRAWLLLADAGTPVGAFGNAPEAWAVAPALYEDMLGRELPLEPDEIAGLRRFAPRFAALCSELAQRVGAFAHVFGWLRLRHHLPPSDRWSMTWLPAILRRAIATAA
ncbi:MAG: hypothetical protein ACRDL2_17610 [Gaiellaceae bacterium]